MKVVVILSAGVTPKQASFNVDSELSTRELKAVLQSISPRFTVTTRQWIREIDGFEFSSLEETVRKVKEATITVVDKYHYKKVEDWHIVEDGVFDYMRFKRGGGKYRVIGGLLYQASSRYVRCTLKCIYKNISTSDWVTTEEI